MLRRLLVVGAVFFYSFGARAADLPPCPKQFVDAWNAFNLAMSDAAMNDKAEPEMPPLPKRHVG